MIKILLLVTAVSIDCFASAISLGSAGIKLPFRSALIISGMGTLFLGVSVGFAEMLGKIIPENLCEVISSAMFIVLGIFNLLKNYIGKLHTPQKGSTAELYFNGTAADRDASKSISAKEAAALSVALSADSLVTGISAGLEDMNIPLLCICTFTAGLAAVSLGWRLGKKIVASFDIDLGWLCGVMLIILAVVK